MIMARSSSSLASTSPGPPVGERMDGNLRETSRDVRARPRLDARPPSPPGAAKRGRAGRWAMAASIGAPAVPRRWCGDDSAGSQSRRGPVGTFRGQGGAREAMAAPSAAVANNNSIEGDEPWGHRSAPRGAPTAARRRFGGVAVAAGTRRDVRGTWGGTGSDGGTTDGHFGK